MSKKYPNAKTKASDLQDALDRIYEITKRVAPGTDEAAPWRALGRIRACAEMTLGIDPYGEEAAS